MVVVVEACLVRSKFFQALNEIIRANLEIVPQIVYADPERHTTRIKMLVINRLKKLGLQDLAERIRKRSTRKLIDWLKELQILKKIEYERLLEVYRQVCKQQHNRGNEISGITETLIEDDIAKDARLSVNVYQLVITLYKLLGRRPI